MGSWLGWLLLSLCASSLEAQRASASWGRNAAGSSIEQQQRLEQLVELNASQQRAAMERIGELELCLVALQQEAQNHEMQLLRLEDQAANCQQIAEGQQRHYLLCLEEKAALFDEKLKGCEKRTAVASHGTELLAKELASLLDGLQQQAHQVELLHKQLGLLSTAVQRQEENMGHLRKAVSALIAEEAPATSTAGRFYEVEQGDTLGKIADRFKVSLRELREVNQLTSDKIFPHQKLTIPPAAASRGAQLP